MIGQFTGAVVFANETVKLVDVSSQILDATKSAPALYDELGAIALLKLEAISATTFRISSEIPLTATYTLVVIGQGIVIPPDPTPTPAMFSPPMTVRKNWTYAQAREKLIVDLNLEDDLFIKPNELIGYFNEGIDEAESEIHSLHEDYFLTKFPLPLVEGLGQYSLPQNIYANKIRGIMYQNGSQIYPVTRFRRRNVFENMAFADQYGQNDDYRYLITNDTPGNPLLELRPPARETAVVPPSTPSFTPMIVWYIRHANRIPLLGEFVQNWDVCVQAATVDTFTSKIVTKNRYVTGDVVALAATGSMPGGLVSGTLYYVIAGAGYIKLATSITNALTGTAITITAVGSGVLTIAIAANQWIVDNTIIDIPEFMKFIIQWAKCRCMEKEGDPRLEGAGAVLVQQKKQMVDSLTNRIEDDDEQIQPDFSHYQDMN